MAKEIILRSCSALESLIIFPIYGDKKYKVKLNIIDIGITNFNVL